MILVIDVTSFNKACLGTIFVRVTFPASFLAIKNTGLGMGMIQGLSLKRKERKSSILGNALLYTYRKIIIIMRRQLLFYNVNYVKLTVAFFFIAYSRLILGEYSKY